MSTERSGLTDALIIVCGICTAESKVAGEVAVCEQNAENDRLDEADGRQEMGLHIILLPAMGNKEKTDLPDEFKFVRDPYIAWRLIAGGPVLSEYPCTGTGRHERCGAKLDSIHIGSLLEMPNSRGVAHLFLLSSLKALHAQYRLRSSMLLV